MVRFFICLLLTVIPAAVFAECTLNPDATEVHFAGVAYLGAEAQLAKNYPRAISLNTRQDGRSRFDAVFDRHLNSRCVRALTIRQGLANLNAGEHLVMAIAIDKEQLSLESLDNSHLMIADVNAQVIFVDFNEMALVASFPVDAAQNHMIKGRSPTEADIAPLFKSLYFGDGKTPGLLQKVAERVTSIDVASVADFRIGVTSVTVAEAAASVLPEDMTAARFAQFYGQYFVARLAHDYPRLSVLPYTRGYAIGNRMPGRFANGDVFNLTVPEPDFAFAVAVNNFRSADTGEGNRLYAVRMNVRHFEPLQDKTYFQDDLQYAVAKLIARSHTRVNHWAAYEDASEALADELIGQLGAPNRKWVNTHARNPKTSFKQLAKLERIYRK